MFSNARNSTNTSKIEVTILMGYMYFFITFPTTLVVFAKNESEISPFLKIIVYYKVIEEKRVGRSPQEI